MTKYFDRNNNRLVFYEQSATPDFWDKHWNVTNFKAEVQKNKNNRLILENTKKYLSGGTILEGGCGMGGNVYCLHSHGYSAYGVDFAEKTVKKINEHYPELKVTVGDVRNLQYGDDFFDGYWSLGVIEHFEKGYEDILKEMKRTVKTGGYVFVTFPFMSFLRKLKAKCHAYKDYSPEGCNGEEFYQYALDSKAVEEDFKKYGFQLQYKKSFDGLKGLKTEMPFMKPILQPLYDYNGKILAINYFRLALSSILAYFTGHIILLVLKKTE